MKKASFLLAAAGFLALAGCGQKNEDQLNQNEVNAVDENLDELSNEAANVANEQDALQNQQDQLNKEAAGNAVGPQTPADENIQGM